MLEDLEQPRLAQNSAQHDRRQACHLRIIFVQEVLLASLQPGPENGALDPAAQAQGTVPQLDPFGCASDVDHADAV